MSRPLLKQDYDLTSADFRSSKVWVNVHGLDEGKPWYKNSDEATFRPWHGRFPVDPAKNLFLVAARMTLVDGTRLAGAFYAHSLDQASDKEASNLLGNLQPRVFINDLSFSFWGGRAGISSKSRKAFCDSIGVTAEDAFPILFEAEEECVLGVSNGIIEGFYRLIETATNNEEVLIERSGEAKSLQGDLTIDLPQLLSPIMLASQGEFELALKMANEAIAADSKNPDNWHNRSIINRRKGDHCAAAEDALSEVECQPGNGELYPWLCLMLNEAEMFSDCIRFARVGINAQFQNPEVEGYCKGQIRFHLARALYEKGEFEEALSILDGFPPGFGISGSLATNRMAHRNFLIRACKAKIKQLEKTRKSD